MKKSVTIFALIIIFLISYFLQANFFNWFTISGVKANLFIILILFISLYAGIKIGVPFGIIGGLFLDIVIGKSIGASAIALGIIGVIGGYFDKNFSKESKLTIMLMVVGSTFIYEVATYIFHIIQLSIHVEIIPFIIKLLIEMFFNMVLTIILYPIIQKLGYKIEDIFKGSKILTRYF